MTGVGGYGTVWTAAWMSDAKPGEERGIGGVLGIVFCLLAVGIGISMLRFARGVLRGRPNTAAGLLNLFGILLSLSGLGLATGLFDDSLPTDEWVQRLTVFAAVCATSLAGVLLCRARGTVVFAPPRPVRPRGTGR
jgi:hypothetical protein